MHENESTAHKVGTSLNTHQGAAAFPARGLPNKVRRRPAREEGLHGIRTPSRVGNPARQCFCPVGHASFRGRRRDGEEGQAGLLFSRAS